MAIDLGSVFIASVVETRLTLKAHSERPSYARDTPNEHVMSALTAGILHRHEVHDLRHTFARGESRHQHVGLR